ncbi:MAG TPA: VTT domain-containing protein [Terriglobales bacterium]
MNNIKHLLARYSAFLWALLKPLGAWGVMVVAMLDGGFIGLPMDVVVAGYVYNDRPRFLWYAVSAALGSAIGSIVIYVIGYIGGENLLRKRIPAQRFEKIHSAFDKHPFWALMFPAMLPPPTPFKLFVLAAAVCEMSFWRFLLAVFCGRMVRFLALAVLTLEFGPDVVHIAVNIFSKHLTVVLVVMAAGAIGWLLHWWSRRQGQTA